MFDIRRVRERVAARSKTLRAISEEELHLLYAKAIAEELEIAKRAASEIRGLVLRVQAHHPDQKWIMVSSDDRVEAERRLTTFIGSF